MRSAIVLLWLWLGTSAAAAQVDDEVPPPVSLEVAATPAPPPTAVVAAPTATWPSSPAAPGASVRPHRVHGMDLGLTIAGSVLFGLGYVGSIAWGAYYFASLPLPNVSCNDTYAGLHFLPFVGSLVAAGTVSQCATPRGEEIALPILFAAPQVLGAILFAAGLVGSDHIEYEGWSLALDAGPDHAFALLSTEL